MWKSVIFFQKTANLSMLLAILYGQILYCHSEWHIVDPLINNSQNLISNSSYCLPYDSYDNSLENLEIDQPVIP